MDGAVAFLHRHERRALARARKGEPWRALVPVMTDGATGLLAVTPTRLLHARRGRLRTSVRTWRRRETGIRFQSKGRGALLLAGRGRRVRLELLDARDRAILEAAILPPAVPPIRRQDGARPASGPPTVDPLAHRGTAAHRARLQSLHARGMLSRAELEWQLDA